MEYKIKTLNYYFIMFYNNKVNHVSLLGDLKSLRVFHYGGTKFPNPYNAIAKLLPGKFKILPHNICSYFEY